MFDEKEQFVHISELKLSSNSISQTLCDFLAVCLIRNGQMLTVNRTYIMFIELVLLTTGSGFAY
jgi:hypothetical protein